MVNRSGLVASGKRGGLDSAVPSLISICGHALHFSSGIDRASRALQTAPPPTIVFALRSNPGEQF
jgi:hypothetical protein